MIGTQVGPFTMIRRLGEGGMGSVYLAEHTVLKTRRAVKFLSPQLTQNAQLVRRFVNEARAAATLHHRNLIQVHDVGQLPGGAWFMVLDYLDGHTLGRLMATRGDPLPPPLIIHIVAEIANGLAVAHRHQIIHRDLKPENVFLIVREGDPYHPVLLDFGVAQLGDDFAPAPRLPGDGGPGEPEHSTTRNGVVIGTPAYMPPEQLRGAKVSPAADIFALGVIAYQMCTGGWFPYQHAESRQRYCELPATELYHRQMTWSPVDPRDRCTELSSAWAGAILAAMSPDPAMRPATAGAFALRLAEALAPTGDAPGGLAIIQSYARELLDERNRVGGGPDGRAGGEGGSRAPIAPAAAGVPAAAMATDIGSRYRLGDQLGTGGMAEVFAGTMLGVEGFARRVAIKRVLSGLSQVPAFATMFVAEAQIASRLAHPNIVSVLDFTRDSDGRLVLVMEYVDGKDLATVLEAGPIAPSLAIFITTEMLRGLGYAHDLPEPLVADAGQVDAGGPYGDLARRRAPVAWAGTRGVIHRDVSPQNLLVSREGAVKVSDFGLAKARAASGVWSETVRGKPGYMSPEQCAGEALDGRSDLYSVGVMLWEMLAHRPLFTGTSKEILTQVMFKDVPAPGSVRSGVPADLESIAMTLLARDRNARFSTAEAAIEALLSCASAPRDGRGELVSLLAGRFPRAAGSRSSGSRRRATESVPRSPRPAQITVPEPPSTFGGAASQAVRSGMRPRRGMFAATVSGVALAGLAAAAVLGGGPIARSGTTDRVAGLPEPPVVTVPAAAPVARAVPAGRAAPAAIRVDTASAVSTPGLAPVALPGGAPAAHPVAYAAQRRDRVVQTGELAIIVKPWAMIWLNGKPRGQTPFRAPVPAGRYRVRLVNDDIGQDEITIIAVEADRTATVERSW